VRDAEPARQLALRGDQTGLRADHDVINAARSSQSSDRSSRLAHAQPSANGRSFPPPKSGRIAVKVINHYGDEAMRVFRV
jgi:adenine-specific DNA-methyltransferase